MASCERQWREGRVSATLDVKESPIERGRIQGLINDGALTELNPNEQEIIEIVLQAGLQRRLYKERYPKLPDRTDEIPPMDFFEGEGFDDEYRETLSRAITLVHSALDKLSSSREGDDEWGEGMRMLNVFAKDYMSKLVPERQFDPDNPSDVVYDFTHRWVMPLGIVMKEGVPGPRVCSDQVRVAAAIIENYELRTRPRLVKTVFQKSDGSMGTHTLLMFSVYTQDHHYLDTISWDVSSGLPPVLLTLQEGELYEYSEIAHPEDAPWYKDKFLVVGVERTLSQMGLYTAWDEKRFMEECQIEWDTLISEDNDLDSRSPEA